MMNLRSVGALLAISTALSCATAINQEAGNGATPTAGSDSGGGAGLEEEGGAPAVAGAPQQAGAPSSAGKGGTGSAGKGGGGNAGSTSKGGSGGTVGVSGAGGANSGGKAGTSSSGAGGSGTAGTAGTAGGTSTGPCASPIDLPTTAMNTGSLDTVDAACYRTKAKFTNLVCSNWDGRTVKVNDVLVMCSATTFAAAIDGWNYFDISAGKYTYAQLGWYGG